MGAGCDLPRRQRDRHDHIDDPSEDALYMLIDDLNDSDNTFVAIQPDEGDPAWFTSVAVLDAGGYEVVRRGTTRHRAGFPLLLKRVLLA